MSDPDPDEFDDPGPPPEPFRTPGWVYVLLVLILGCVWSAWRYSGGPHGLVKRPAIPANR